MCCFLFHFSLDNCSYEPQMFIFELSVQLVLSFGYLLIFIAGVTGNTLVLWVVLSNSEMRTTTNLYILNLSLGDILMCLGKTIVDSLRVHSTSTVMFQWPYL